MKNINLKLKLKNIKILLNDIDRNKNYMKMSRIFLELAFERIIFSIDFLEMNFKTLSIAVCI